MEAVSAAELKSRMKWNRHAYSFSGIALDGPCETCGENRGASIHVPYDPKQHVYPRMVHKAYKRDDGRIMYGAPEPHPSHFKEASDYWAAMTTMEHTNRKCQRIVNSDREYEEARVDGWRDTPTEALNYLKGLEDDISRAAAERHFDDRRMSEKAKAEAAAVDEATDQHVAEVPEKKRRGRPRKIDAIAS